MKTLSLAKLGGRALPGALWLSALSACALMNGGIVPSAGAVAPKATNSSTDTSAAMPSDHSNYPEEWWRPVARDGAPGWEILPQEAGPGEVVLSKRTELGILSNFAPTPFEYDGHRYASVEGFWQMMKYPEGRDDFRSSDPTIHWPYTRDEVAAMSAFDAKRAGSEANKIMKRLGIEWVTYQGKRIPYLENAKGEFYQLVRDAEWAKLRQNDEVKQILLKTGNLALRPDHHQSADSAPAWRYHEIWMEIRAEVIKESKKNN
jgi:predicted NAD-dependent protein-ADP-ribosyltransferase YbiA (DUF1768 family)